MQPIVAANARDSRLRLPFALGVCLFLATALFLLWEEHRAHILGAAPYALLLLCPLVHLLMHRGHHGDPSHHHGGGGRP